MPFVQIDQECIDQSDGVEKEHAIHAMHLVYRNAKFSIALLIDYEEI
jgi:hypothetical protein